MPVPDFVVALRERVGRDLLWMPGVTGVVRDGEGRVLLGRRADTGQWALPSGILEPGEQPAVGLVREVEEETGIIGRAVSPLGTIGFWFVAERRRVHKTLHHFLLRALGGELCDDDVEVAEVAWVPLGDLESRLAYADERRLIRRATQLLADSA